MREMFYKIIGAVIVLAIGLFAPSAVTFVCLMLYGILTRGSEGIILVGIVLDAIYAPVSSFSVYYTLASFSGIIIGRLYSRYGRSHFAFLSNENKFF